MRHPPRRYRPGPHRRDARHPPGPAGPQQRKLPQRHDSRTLSDAAQVDCGQGHRFPRSGFRADSSLLAGLILPQCRVDRLRRCDVAARLRHEPRCSPQVLRLGAARRQNDRHRGILTSTMPRQSQTIQDPRHLNIGEHDIDAHSRAEVVQCLVGARRFNNKKPAVRRSSASAMRVRGSSSTIRMRCFCSAGLGLGAPIAFLPSPHISKSYRCPNVDTM